MTFGGSVAYGHGTAGIDRNDSFGKVHENELRRRSRDGNAHDRFIGWLKSRYPQTQITYRNMALPATTSMFTLSHFKTVFRGTRGNEFPDLVLLDYSTNDALESDQGIGQQSEYWKKTRSVTELLLRSMLRLSSLPAIMLLSLPRNGGQNLSVALGMQDVAYVPTSRQYGVVMVSYVNAIQSSPDVPHLFDEAFTSHPLWHSTQMIADCMAFAWSRVEGSMGPRYSAAADPLPPLPSLQFEEHTAESLTPCDDNGWITSLSSYQGRSGFAPYEQPSAAWRYVDGEKPGWVFNASASKIAERGDMSVMEPITFQVNFSSDRPRLVFGYLRSHLAQYGRAVFWLHGTNDGRDGDDSKAASLSRSLSYIMQQQSFRDECKRAWLHFRCWEKAMHCTEDSIGRPCLMQRINLLADPHVLDSHWGDPSSQLVTLGFANGLSSQPAAEKGPMSYTRAVLDNQSLPLADPGVRLLSVGVLRGRLSHASPGMSLARQPVGLPATVGSMFKLASIHSC